MKNSLKKDSKKESKKVVKVKLVKTETYREDGESKVKSTYDNGIVIVSTL